MKSIISVL